MKKQIEKATDVSDTIIDPNDPICKQYNELINDITLMYEQISNIKHNVKKFYKNYVKQLSRFNKLKKPNAKPRKPTGFRTLADVPPSIIKLLELKNGEKSTRPRITKQIYDYIDQHKLHDKNDNRLIRVNNKLAEALQLTPEQAATINNTSNYRDENGLNFYNIQKHIARVYSNFKLDKPVVVQKQEESDEEEEIISLKKIKTKK